MSFDGAAEGARDPGGERRDERDEREPDHQRRRGGGGALRVPAGVVAREHALQRRRSASPAQPSTAASGRTSRDEKSATPMKIEQRADAHPEQDLRRPEAVPNRP